MRRVMLGTVLCLLLACTRRQPIGLASEDALQRGLTMSQVESLFGTPLTASGLQPAAEIRSYYSMPTKRLYTVRYIHGQVAVFRWHELAGATPEAQRQLNAGLSYG